MILMLWKLKRDEEKFQLNSIIGKSKRDEAIFKKKLTGMS